MDAPISNIKEHKHIGNHKNGKYISVNNVRLYYEIYGHGKPLLLLHGNGQSMAAFTYQLEVFSKYYKVILVDCRGRGKSSFDRSKELTFALQAEDIKLFLDSLHIEKTHIVGWSDGGIIGLVFAIMYPKKVTKLVTMGSNINPEGLKDLEELHHYIKKLQTNNINHKNDMRILLCKLMANYPTLTYKDLHAITAKTLIMVGDQDSIKHSHTIKIYEAIKDAQLAILPNESHFLPIENPTFFNELVLKFLK